MAQRGLYNIGLIVSVTRLLTRASKMSVRALTFLQLGYRRSTSYVIYRSKATSSETNSDVDPEHVKLYSEIPGPKGLPVVGTMFETMKHMDKMYELIRRRHEQYGPIYKEKLGPLDLVFLTDVEAVEQLLRQDGKYPSRLEIEHWVEYRKERDINMGLLMSEGERWQSLRRVIDKHMMKIKTVESYIGEFNKVVDDFLKRLARIRTPDKEIPQLNNELFNWSLESIGSILYEKRLGCLKDTRTQDTNDFIQSEHDIFETTRQIMFLPRTLAKLLKPGVCKEHDKAWDRSFKVAHKTIEERIRDINEKANEGEHVGFITHFLKEDTMSIKDVYANISDLMGAAIDTTSNTVVMALYEMSRNPRIQEALLEEVNRVVPPCQQPEAEHLREMHYIKAVIKETLRKYPITGGLTRKVQKDMTLLGYNIPNQTTVFIDLIGIGRLARHYEDPDTFRPERWLRDQRTTKPHPFAWLPFGFGPRSCVGRRVAELEMQLLITQLVRKFRLEPVSNEPVEMITNLLLLPKDPIRVRAFDRS